MLRRGASLLVKPQDDGTPSLIAAYTADSEMLTAMRAAAWAEPPEDRPPPGSEERGEQFELSRFPASTD
jgi:hypothetical protein